MWVQQLAEATGCGWLKQSYIQSAELQTPQRAGVGGEKSMSCIYTLS